MKTGFSLYVHSNSVFMYVLAFAAGMHTLAFSLWIDFQPFSLIAALFFVFAVIQASTIYRFESKFK